MYNAGDVTVLYLTYGSATATADGVTTAAVTTNTAKAEAAAADGGDRRASSMTERAGRK